jgi:hypothetical protein
MRTIRLLALMALASTLCVVGLRYQTAKAQVQQVKLYFPHQGDSADSKHNPSNLQPVTRKINAAAPLRPAMEALLNGPSSDEKQQGFYSLSTDGLSIVRVSLVNGAALVSFVHRKGTVWPGDLAPLTFQDAVERTLKQFPRVRRTIICVDGYLDFGDESDKGPHKRCK